MSNHIAPEGTIYVCTACGRRSRDRDGEQPLQSGWDSSCRSNAVLCTENGIGVDANGLVRHAQVVEEPIPEPPNA